VPIALFGCDEDQARESLHLHVVHWGGIPAHLFQRGASYKALTTAVAKALDSIVKCEVEAEFHVEHLLHKAEGVVPPRHALSTARHSTRQPDEFYEDVQKTVIGCNIHGHSQTCKAGIQMKKSCRMRRPQPIESETSCCQIEPFQDGKYVRTYRIPPGFTAQQIDSLSMRNISRLPIPLRDNRLITLQYK
jgi:hypothetical protein